MKIGIAVGELRGPADADELVAQVRAAADAGFSTAWASQAFGWDALTALAVAGAQVPGIALGSAVVPVPQRHPLLLAGQALSVQAATGGDRFTLGVGAGVAAMTEGMFGLDARQPARRMREYLTVLLPLLRGETVGHRGDTLTAVGSVQVPGATAPSVLVAALGPAMLQVAGELADGTVTWMTGPRTLGDHIVPSITKAAESAGRAAPRVVAGLIVSVTADPAAVRERVAARFGMAGQVPEYRAVLDREGANGPQDVVVAGDESHVRRELDRLADTGVTELLAAPFGDDEEQARTLALLADVAPAITPLSATGF
jgi:F420-dependent oxidoreductase-like protein